MPELICDRCRQNYSVWFTENELWNKISGGFNMLCPTCFCFLALINDYKTTGWLLTPEEHIPHIATSQLTSKFIESDDICDYCRGISDNTVDCQGAENMPSCFKGQKLQI